MRGSDFMIGGHDFKTLVASQMMETNINWVKVSSTWRETAKIMAEYEMKSIPVVDDNKGLVGLITEYDILGPVAGEKDVKNIKAGDIVSRDIQVISADTPAMEVLKIFDDKRVFKILVTENGALKGVIVKHDVLHAYLSATEEGVVGF